MIGCSIGDAKGKLGFVRSISGIALELLTFEEIEKILEEAPALKDEIYLYRNLFLTFLKTTCLSSKGAPLSPKRLSTWNVFR